MTKKAAVWAIVLIIAGLLLTTVALFAVDFDFTKMNADKFTTNTHTVEEPFQNIHISAKIGTVKLALSDNNTCRVDCLESEEYNFTVSVADDTLTIEGRDTRAWYEHIGIHITNPEVTVYLPQTDYKTLNITNTTGDVLVEKGFTFQDVNLHVTTGDIDWKESNATNMALQSTTGDITLTGAATEVLAVKVSTGDILLANTTAHTLSATGTTGDIRFDRFDARSITVKTTTGQVTGTLQSPKQFITSTTTGDVQVPQNADTTDTCKISVTTGDIRITIAK